MKKSKKDNQTEKKIKAWAIMPSFPDKMKKEKNYKTGEKDMTIDIKEIINKPEFTTIIAEFIASKFEQELYKEWQEDFMKEFEKQLKEIVKNQVSDYIQKELENIPNLENNIKKVFIGLTKKEIIELLKQDNNLSF